MYTKISKYFYLSFALVLFKQWLWEMESKIPIIKPNQPLKIIWDFLIVFIIYIYFHLIPMQISFDFFYDDELVSFCEKFGIQNLEKLLVLIPKSFFA